ncbi:MULTISPECIES: hypothetical protein [unclassified Streptomyces]|uniref:hypothetical protein n=1 Tax=unclassified Streptomyces TaxID=2593676 RepID=UPI0023650E9D|nr:MULTISPECIES: hypothetical protein [unclassified Streptomyces]MDF3141943.1 hypothetical protein [Streptomyces sp. T21Q-yed]WDF40350.1 hypothetical protein PBV52_27990 [Streptomyces sp. T12]
MAGWQRALWWTLTVVGAVAAVVLLVWVSTADLEQSSQAAGVIGSVAGIAALGVGLWQLRLAAASSPSAVEPVQAEAGSNAARGSIRNARAQDTAPGAGTSPNGGPGIRATGGSNAAGGDIDGSTARHGQ